ncbi:sensor histidine kinase [Paenibacillus shunpengii]|uniref:Sensor histidine kinase n=1 Tax=Paenibacillus shunpengii TaxID=2054424 RepID=A0ABW5STF2_9BACL|nr:sensor histidine kinase [Paenibacillus sp. PDC88]SDX19734.1 two-component system, sensor histidine kinase YesM [Paenibacillus sp. PDC88]
MRKNKFHTLSTFAKINLILLFMLIPLIGLNYYQNLIGTKVVRNEIHRSSETYMSLLTSQIETIANQMSVFALTMNRDSNLSTFTTFEGSRHPYDRYNTIYNIYEKLKLNSLSLPWNNQITVYSPANKKAVSDSGLSTYDEAFLKNNMTPVWKFMPTDYKYGQPYFIRHFSEPKYSSNAPLDSYRIVSEISFSSNNLIKMLEKFKNRHNVHDPFLYSPGYEPLVSNTAQLAHIEQLGTILNDQTMTSSGHETLELQGEKYLVTYKLIDTLGWYLVDYVPIHEALAPIYRSSLIFYTSAAVLIVLCLILSYYIYRNVQIPIRKLLKGARAIAKGDFSTQVEYHSKNEFFVLVFQFNNMARQIKELIESIYESRIRLQQATLKQLQSQIDPHFLYNSLNFIKYSAKKGEEDAVVSMTVHLGAYYRSATRLGKAETTLEEELKLIYNYLEIHKLRMHGMTYDINLPENMAEVEVPRLILQPLVENAIIHGISKSELAGYIRITASTQDGFYMLCVEDNGPGIQEQEQKALIAQIANSKEEDDLCGLWNVAQRINLKYGESAGIGIESSSYGGLKIWLYWPSAADKG